MNQNVQEIYYTVEDLDNSGTWLRSLAYREEDTEGARIEMIDTIRQMLEQTEHLVETMKEAISELEAEGE